LQFDFRQRRPATIRVLFVPVLDKDTMPQHTPALSTIGQPRRHRASSCGSISGDVAVLKKQPTSAKTTTTTTSSSAAAELMQILLQLRDANGDTILHSLSSNDKQWLGLSSALLNRAAELGTAVYKQWTTAPDTESGYTPLHRAVFSGNLAALLLLLRGPEQRLLQRPMDLFNNETPTDAEGLTPLALLGRLARRNLRKCRESLRTPITVTIPAVTTAVTNNRKFDKFMQDNDEFADLSDAMAQNGVVVELADDEMPSPQHQPHQPPPSYACEVLTFGRAHHCALGVSDASTTAIKSRPCRVTEFALSERRCSLASAVMVAAAAYHSLVVTKNGHLYAFGWNKNGRLGTGNERHVPLPVRISGGGLNKKLVTFVAAAENHSLAVTTDGMVYGWGSNRFGQLGKATEATRILPKRVDDLKNCVAVAAGDKHSVALTNDGQVYTWGDNASGQLGCLQKGGGVQRVEAMWKCQPRKVAIAIAASDHSTLVLCCPSGAGLRVNSVYAWGHGNHLPSKVNFDTKQRGSSNYRQNVNPIAITSAKFHSAVVTDDGCVYCWGLHAESLGMPKNQSHSSPQLVTGMLPQNGGGIAVAVSASEHHTAVVTDEGHLFTWGAHTQQNVLGHEGVRFQPTPKQVPGVYRAVGVASAKEHTILLVGTSFPHIPRGRLTLENMAARKVAEHVDMFNVVPIFIMAERTHCSLLSEYCRYFVKWNLDGVLNMGRKSEMNVFLNEQLAESKLCMSRDMSVHPLVYDLMTAGDNRTTWMEGCDAVLANLPISMRVRYRDRKVRESRTRALSFHQQKEHDDRLDTYLQTGFQGCSDGCLILTGNMANLVTHDEIRSKYYCLSKEVRGIRKRLMQIAKLRIKETLTPVERDKLARKPLLEADVAMLERALEQVNRLMAERNMVPNKEVLTDVSQREISETKIVDTAELVNNDEPTPLQYHCQLCGVSCPDANHLDLHTNGRKHRNRVLQGQEAEQNAVAADMMEAKRKQTFKSHFKETLVSGNAKSSPWGKSSIEPRYSLPPPPLGVGPAMALNSGKITPNTESFKQSSIASTDFRSILAEEEKKKASTPKAKLLLNPKKQMLLSPGSFPSLQNAPWIVAPPTARETPTTPIGQMRNVLLGEFLSPSVPKPVIKKIIAAPWSASPIVVSPLVQAPSPGQVKSLRQIQQEEQEFQIRNKAKNELKEGKWYIQRSERPGSFSAIQEADAREREMALLIEEQKHIEEQIALENSMKQHDVTSKNSKKRANAKGKKQTGDNHMTQAGTKPAATSRRNKSNEKSDVKTR